MRYSIIKITIFLVSFFIQAIWHSRLIKPSYESDDTKSNEWWEDLTIRCYSHAIGLCCISQSGKYLVSIVHFWIQFYVLGLTRTLTFSLHTDWTTFTFIFLIHSPSCWWSTGYSSTALDLITPGFSTSYDYKTTLKWLNVNKSVSTTSQGYYIHGPGSRWAGTQLPWRWRQCWCRVTKGQNKDKWMKTEGNLTGCTESGGKSPKPIQTPQQLSAAVVGPMCSGNGRVFFSRR